MTTTTPSIGTTSTRTDDDAPADGTVESRHGPRVPSPLYEPVNTPPLLPGVCGDCRGCPFVAPDHVLIGHVAGVEVGPEPVCSGDNPENEYFLCSRQHRTAPDPKACRACPIRCGSRHDIADWMIDVGGTFTFDDLALAQPAWPDVPTNYWAQVDDGDMTDFHAAAQHDAYAIGFRRVFSEDTHKFMPRWLNTPANDTMRVGDAATMCIGMGQDPLVEAFWTRRWADGLFDQIASMNWDVFLVPNPSLYLNQPRSEALINFRRSLMMACELQQHAPNTVVVPNVYWARKEDLDRWLEWIIENEPVAMATNLQTFRWDDWWDDMIAPGLAYIAARLDEAGLDTRWVCTGASRQDRIRQLQHFLGDRLVVVSQNALQIGRRGAVIRVGSGDGKREDLHLKASHAFAENVAEYRALVDGPVPVN